MKTNANHKNYIKTNALAKEKAAEKAMEKKPIFAMAKGLMIAFAITCIFFIGYGILIAYYDMSYDQLPIVVLVCTAISSLVAGHDFAICSTQKGIFIGGFGGVVYLLLLCLVVHFAEGNIDFSGSVWKMGMVAIFSGAIGGIFGANRRPSGMRKY